MAELRKKREQENSAKNKTGINFQTEDNISFVQNELGLTAENITVVREALAEAQALCNKNDENRIKSALDIVNQASNKLGTASDIPTLVNSEGSSTDSFDTASSNDELINDDKRKQAKQKKLQKRLNKKKQGNSSIEMFKLMLEEQKKSK